jgi:hypothetical protein
MAMAIAIKPKSSGAKSLARMIALITFKPLAQILAAVTQSAPLLTFLDKELSSPISKPVSILSVIDFLKEI